MLQGASLPLSIITAGKETETKGKSSETEKMKGDTEIKMTMSPRNTQKETEQAVRQTAALLSTTLPEPR